MRPSNGPQALWILVFAASALGSVINGSPLLAQGASSSTGSTPVAGGSSVTVISDNTAAAKGAKTYCFMRGAGNTHKVSWDAAYGLIKRQSTSLFKTSPEHAAVMITEAVVNNPTAYPDCGKYLGDLFVR